jgi:hypothetical protein
MFGNSERDKEVRGGWRRLHNDELHSLYFSSTYCYCRMARQTIAVKGSYFPSFGILFRPHRNLMKLSGRVINPSQGVYSTNTENNRDVHTPSGIQNHDPNVRVAEDITTR